MISQTRLVVVGDVSGTHLAGSFSRAAEALSIPLAVQEIKIAQSPHRLINALFWRLIDKRPARKRAFSEALLTKVDLHQANTVLTTGLAPVLPDLLHKLRARGIQTIHYSTDDPWNPVMGAGWYFEALKLYDVVFSPRQSTMKQLAELPCKHVAYLPFGFDQDLFPGDDEPNHEGPLPDLLFIGGADDERASFIRSLVANGIRPTLAGGYWDRYRDLSSFSLGNLAPKAMRALTRAAKTNLCLVRRANRDGHVMRSFEIGALGGCAVVEDTQEHRAIFGPEGECVCYFATPEAAATQIKRLLANPQEAIRLGANIKRLIRGGNNTYVDRLQKMIETAQEIKQNNGAIKS